MKRLVLPVLGLVAALVAGCSSSSSSSTSSPSSSSSSSSAAAVSGTLTIYAAASLKKSFDEIAAEFTKQNPGVKVAPIDYDGSSTLVTQLTGGAAADVFASADDKNMKKVTDAKLASGPVEFATNTLEIAVQVGNPKKITGLQDLTKVDTVLCAPAVPCGSAAQTALKAAGVTVTPVSQEQSVTAVLTKVESKDADAGLVYKTDVLASAGKVDGVDFAEAAKAVNNYPIVALSGAKNSAAAAAFLAVVTGPAGQKVLAANGFGPPAG